MEIGITSWSFPACTLAEAAGITRALGIGSIDIGLLHRPALDRQAILSDPDATAADLPLQGLGVSNLYWLFGEGLSERALTKPQHLKENVADFERVCAFGKAAGADTLFVLPGVAEPGRSHDALIATSAEALRELLPIARAHGLALTVEPHIAGILTSPARTLSLLEQCEGVGLTLDYTHFVAMGFTQVAIDPLAPHARHVHVRQGRPGALQTKFAEGTIDLALMVATLRDAGFDGCLSLEVVHQDYMGTVYEDVLTETIQLRDRMREVIG